LFLDLNIRPRDYRDGEIISALHHFGG